MHPDLGPTAPLAPALYPSAVYRLPDLDALDAVYDRRVAGFTYSRDGHPNAAAVTAEMDRLHGAAHGLATGSGMGATSAAVLSVAAAGSRVVASDKLYGTTTKLLREWRKFGVATDFADANDPAAVDRALATGPPAALVIVETISNPLCRVAPLPDLAEVCRRRGARLFVDNTFASPVLCRPLAFGAAVVMESLTKVLGGHSDLTLGYLGTNDAALAAAMTSMTSLLGQAAAPFDCWLAERSFATLDLRVRAAAANAQAAAEWLAAQPAVTRVVYPGLADHPDHAAAARWLTAGFGHVLAVELADRGAVNRFLRAGAVPFAPSLGDARTTCSHPASTSHRFEPPERQRALGITPGLIRLSVDCEPTADVLGALDAALAAV